MPYKAPRNCKHGRCPNLVQIGEGGGYCDIHRPLHKNDYPRRNDHNAMYTAARYRRYRTMFLAEHPLCANYADCHNASSVLDHIVDHRGNVELFNNPDNHQALCFDCHQAKTGKERSWGRNI